MQNETKQMLCFTARAESTKRCSDRTREPKKNMAGVRGHPGYRVPGDLGEERLERREGFHDDGEPD